MTRLQAKCNGVSSNWLVRKPCEFSSDVKINVRGEDNSTAHIEKFADTASDSTGCRVK